MTEIITKEAESGSRPEDAGKLSRMPSHYVYVEAPDDAGRLMRVGAMFMHASEQGWAMRLDKNETARQLVFEHGDDLVVLQNRRRVELADQLVAAANPDGAKLKEQTLDSFDQATHPARLAPMRGPGSG